MVQATVVSKYVFSSKTGTAPSHSTFLSAVIAGTQAGCPDHRKKNIQHKRNSTYQELLCITVIPTWPLFYTDEHISGPKKRATGVAKWHLSHQIMSDSFYMPKLSVCLRAYEHTDLCVLACIPYVIIARKNFFTPRYSTSFGSLYGE